MIFSRLFFLNMTHLNISLEIIQANSLEIVQDVAVELWPHEYL